MLLSDRPVNRRGALCRCEGWLLLAFLGCGGSFGAAVDSTDASGDDDGGRAADGGRETGAPGRDARLESDGQIAESGPDDGSMCSSAMVCSPATPAPCGIFLTDCSGGQPACVRVGNQLDGTACAANSVCIGGACQACMSGGFCSTEEAPCKVGSLSCSAGQPTCTAAATSRPDGSSCGIDKVCRAGTCVACAADKPCTPSAGACVEGLTTCGTGTSVCTPVRSVPAGTPCGAAPPSVCNGTGACVPCAAGSACTPTNACRTGAQTCAMGGPMCTDTGQALPNDLFCKVGGMCASGACIPSGSWITRGEDNRTFTGGWLFSFVDDGATIMPLAGEGVTFPTSPGGRSGKGMRVSITMPPQEPMRAIYPVGALGWSFAAQGTMNLTTLGKGLSFYVKSTTAVTLAVRLVDKWTDPRYGYCSLTHDPLIPDWCHNYPEAKCNLVAPAAGQDNWTLCRFVWADFKRDPYSPAKAKELDPTNALSTHVAPSFTAAGAPVARYDITVDDVQFVP